MREKEDVRLDDGPHPTPVAAMTGESSCNVGIPRKKTFSERRAYNSAALTCTVVSIDYANISYRVCSVCEKTLPEITLSLSTNPDSPPPPPICKYCSFKSVVNPISTGSKRLFRVLMSVATETKVFVVIMFDRVARVLFGCSADEFFNFTQIHPFADANPGKILEGEMLRLTLSKAKNGNRQHLRVASVLPLRSGFQSAFITLQEMHRVSPSS